MRSTHIVELTTGKAIKVPREVAMAIKDRLESGEGIKPWQSFTEGNEPNTAPFLILNMNSVAAIYSYENLV